MKYYQSRETGELFTSYREAKQDFTDNYDSDDPTNAVSFWDIYEEIERPVTYVIQGYEERKLDAADPETFMRQWFTQNAYDHLHPKVIFHQSQDNEWGFKTHVWVWRYSTLYTETFIFEERDY